MNRREADQLLWWEHQRERFVNPVVFVIPLTTQTGPWAGNNPLLYPHIPQGAAGITRNSIALIDQLRAVVQRVQYYLGCLDKEIYNPIRRNILRLFWR